MQLRNTFIVLVLLALVGGYIFFTRAKAPPPTSKLYDITAKDITGITLKYPKQEIRVERRGSNWRMVKPFAVPADTNACDAMAREIANCPNNGTIEEHPASLAPFGLGPGAEEVIATVKGKDLPAIVVGKKLAIGYGGYIKTADKPAVLVTEASFAPAVKRSVADLRDRALMSFHPGEAIRLVIARQGQPALELQKQRDHWQIVKPVNLRADAERMQIFLMSLSNSRVNEFISDNAQDLSQYGLKDPKLVVTVYYVGGPAAGQQLYVGNKEPGNGKDGVYVYHPGTQFVYTIHQWAFNDLDKQVNDLRDRTVLSFEPYQVGQIRVTNKGKSFSLSRRSDGKWLEIDGLKADADTIKVEQLMDRIHGLKAQDFIDGAHQRAADFGMNAPVEEITLLGKDGKSLGWIKLAQVERHNEGSGGAPGALQRVDYYAASSTSPTFYGISAGDFSDLLRSPSDFQTATPIPKQGQSGSKS